MKGGELKIRSFWALALLICWLHGQTFDKAEEGLTNKVSSIRVEDKVAGQTNEANFLQTNGFSVSSQVSNVLRSATNQLSTRSATEGVQTNRSATQPEDRSQRPLRGGTRRGERREESKGASGSDEFSILFEKNIFDPNRRPQSRASRESEAPAQVSIAERPVYIGVYGVMCYETNVLVFVGSSNAEWSGARRPGEMVGPFKIVSANTKQVILQGEEGMTIELAPGQALVKGSTGQWSQRLYREVEQASQPQTAQLTESRDRYVQRGGRAFGGATSGSASSTISGSGSGSSIPQDVLQRLIERRRKELEGGSGG